MQLLLCYDNEGVYVNTYGKVAESEKLNYSKFVWSCRCRRTSCYSGESCRPAWPTLALARSWAGATRPSRSGLDSSLKACERLWRWFLLPGVLRLVTSTGCSCTKRRKSWSSFVREMTRWDFDLKLSSNCERISFRCSSPAPKAVLRAKSTSWRSTNQGWPTGSLSRPRLQSAISAQVA